MHLFIDTNIYLSFYHFTSDDLEELNKLVVLLESKKVTLYVTDQLRSEFNRNREPKIFEALKKLRDQHLNLSFPQLSKDYPEYEELRRYQKEYSEKHSLLLEKLERDVMEKKLKADLTLAQLFSKANHLKTTEEVYAKARRRVEVGNPPGKNGSIGDAISWELLLANVPKLEDLYFITGDRDYISVLDENALKEFLLDEWNCGLRGALYSYKRLSAFFKDKFPHIKLAAELEKEILIQQLAASKNFKTTHGLVAKLSKYDDFTEQQANEIVGASVSNKQIGWIAQDPDVREFLSQVIVSQKTNIDPVNLDALQKLMAPVGKVDADLPF